MFPQITPRIFIVAAFLLLPPLVFCDVNQLEDRVYETAHYKITVNSQLQPLQINTIHSWLIHVETLAGRNVEDLQISVGGGMPQHNHGLPTAPRMTKYLGNGDYLIEGLKFHMAGQWQVELLLKSQHGEDKALIVIDL